MSRLALVTGGTRGIGAAISIRLKNAGYRVVANYAGNDSAAEAFRNEHDIPVMKFDVSDFVACREAIEQIHRDMGSIEVLVNNAGITRDSTLQKMSEDAWHQVLDTNLTSCFNLCRLVIEQMREHTFGRIVNISSINGQAGQYGQVNYAAAKAGMAGFSKALAQENANKGITVNTVAPGYIATEMVRAVPEKVLEKIIAKIPAGRLGEADEVARCVEFLVADESGFITGSTLSVNGGQYMC